MGWFVGLPNGSVEHEPDASSARFPCESTLSRPLSVGTLLGHGADANSTLGYNFPLYERVRVNDAMIRIAPTEAALPLPLLVTGVSGVAGYSAFRYFREAFGEQVVGIRPVNNWRLRGPGIVGCNAEDPAGLARLFERHGFAGVLNCGGNCALKSCELDPELAWRTNVASVENLLAVMKGQSPRHDPPRIVHLSIDLVFSGSRPGGYREEDVPDPVTVYGRTMVAAERLILERWPRACILRISLPMGVSFNGHAGAIDWIQSRFRQSRAATLYYDEIRTPIYTDCLNRLCATMLAGDWSGLYHAGGPRRLSLYQIAQVVNRVGGYDPRLLKGCMRIEAGPMPPRAGDVTLHSTKLVDALGHQPFAPWPLRPDDVPDEFDWHRRDARNSGSPALLEKVLHRRPDEYVNG
jgi:dTDP-4-dehydrorhamnose reductase